MLTYDKETLDELQDQILTSNVTDNSLMKPSKIKSKNKQLMTNCKGVVQAINEVYEKGKQIEEYTTRSVLEQNALIGDAYNDPAVMKKLKSLAPSVIEGLVVVKNQIDDVLQLVLDDYEDVFSVNNTITEFKLTYVPIGKIRMYVNGVRQFKTCFRYNPSRNSVTWVFTKEKGGFDIEDSEVVFEYDYNREDDN